MPFIYLTTYYVPLNHLPLIACHLLLTTCHLLLATCRLLLIAYNFFVLAAAESGAAALSSAYKVPCGSLGLGGWLPRKLFT